MCGVCGEFRLDGGAADVGAVQAMAEVMVPRGPDGGGVFAQGRIALGHRRLKVIDLSDHAQQPMVDPALGLAIVFNGCIYNYPQLRDDLIAKGYTFFSHGDTEVILKAYHAWGRDCVRRFQGMFAFCLWERDSGRVVLARDRLGIKPLYLAEGPGRLRFASSLPALLAAGDVDTAIDPVALHHYLTFHAVVPPPHTILKGVRKLPPATVAVIEPDGTRKDMTYWTMAVQPAGDDLRRSFEDWQDLVLESLRTAVRRRLVADVPVGVLLSGGLDSSLITGLLAEEGQTGLKTFSVGFEAAGGESGDEFQYSDIVAEHYGTDHHRIFVPSERLLDTLPETFRAMNEPMVSYDNVGFYLLSKEVSKHVIVVQSGQGADEVFGGYHWYPPLVDSNDPVGDYARVFFDRDHREFSRVVHPRFVNGDHSLDFVRAHFDRPGADRAVDKALRLDTTVMLADDPVKRVDNMTMAWGLEARVPFLDHELVDLAGRIPAEHKLRDEGKGVLKAAARRVIPAAVIDRPKGYFPVPALKYIQGPYLDFVRDALHSRAARERDLFQADALDTLLTEPDRHITPLRGSKLWQVALLELWMQTHGL
ncbi:N-acetylglutaminylglutamine amidotransferase [Roseospira visakhapatnamensis]|uniref:asparagine synthase (glutamine-hydrolyzing) n=1 Tax=Roseospira visakhapatnamensis TaxID=390880 RepID=A0A7W6RB89_9PROT|nr:N-acetylglutaminylglutamine amidotransferase [Roseospira visakhapatnamensis]MBB4265328.1 asparagine synthase (glutamine-hydrolyzing) [Roseospira visakhapatnamensis]